MANQACCICSALLDTYDPTTEKSIVPDRHLSCCGRVICLRCTNQNPRYQTYCPYCQISSVPSVLPQGLRDPPPYASDDNKKRHAPPPSSAAPLPKHEPPPAYTPASYTSSSQDISNEKSAHLNEPIPEPALHFLHPTDTLPSLSLAYSIPASVLRRANNLYSDHLVRGRKAVLIPGEYLVATGGVSLSPEPVLGEEEERRIGQVRRWMMGTKCAEHDVAQLYLEQAQYDVDEAVAIFKDDEEWERQHPLDGSSGGLSKGRGRGLPRRKDSAKSVGMRRFVGK